MLYLVSLVTLLGLTIATNPGVKVRVTQKGIDYASTVAQQALAQELKSLHLDNQSGKDGHISWEFKNIQNKGVTPPSMKLSFDPKHNAMALALSGLSISLRADWRIKYKKGWIKASTSGSVDVKVKSVSVAVSVSLGISKDGRPLLKTASCSANVGGVDLHFHGGTGWLINLFKHPLEKKVRDMLQGQVCKVVQKEVNVDGNQALSKLKVTVELDHRFIVDYSLSAAPAVSSSYLDVLDKGEVYWKGDKSKAPFSPKVIPPLTEQSRMLYLWLTEYTAHTMFYVAQKHGYLKLNVTKNDLPGKNSSYLDTSCRLVCIGKLIPQIGQKFPNRQVKLVIQSTAAPAFSMSPKGISVGLTSNIDMYAEKQGEQSAYLLTLNLTLSLSVKGQIVKERLVGEITDHSFDLDVVKSAVGDLNPTILNMVLKGLLTLVVIPELNHIAEAGVDLPVTGGVKFNNTSLTLLQGSLVIATDLVYSPSDSADNQMQMVSPRQDEWRRMAKEMDQSDQELMFRVVY